MKSIWMKDYINKNLPSINENSNTEVLIIGGGIAGLMCAYHFMKNNIKFILVEGNKIAKGVSANTTAQISFAHDAIYDEIKRKHNEDTAIRYLKSQMEGLDIIKQIIKDENIVCDYKEESTIIYANEDKNIKVLNEQYQMLKKYTDIKPLIASDNIIKYNQAIEFEKQFIFNPMKYMISIIDILLKNNIKLYENSKVTKINKQKKGYEVIINDKYKIQANQVVMACHYPFLNPDNLYFTKIYQSKSYVVSFKSKLKLKANYLSLDKPYFYLRTYDDSTLIIGGSDHFTGIDIDIKKCYETLIKRIYELDKNAIIQDKWFTEDCMPIDNLPFVGQYSNKNPDILLVTGFQKWGFTNIHIAAINITNMLINKPYDDLYSPNRKVLIKDIKSTLRMINHSINGLVISKLFIKKYKIEDIDIDSGKVMKFNNMNILVYREDKDKYHFFMNKCTHMGCSLIWNDVDKICECRCHGSIFDKYGKVIYGPAIKDLEKIYINIK